MPGSGPFQQSNSRKVSSGMVADTVLWASSTRRGPRLPHHMIHQITVIIPEFRSAENAIDAGLLFAPSGVALGHGVVSSASIRQRCRWNPEGATAKARWNNRVKRAHEAEGTSNELMPRAVSRRRRDQLVVRLETLHTSIPNAGEPMAKAPFNHSPSAPAIEPPIDRRCARAAEHSSRRLSPTAGN